MSVFKRGANWGIGYSLNGEWVRKMIGPSKKMAEQAERKIKLEIAAGKYLGIKAPKHVIFDNLCGEYLVYSEANKESSRRDRTSIKNLLKAFSGRFVSEIRARDLERYMVQRIQNDGVKAATVNREVSCIKHIYTKAVDWGYVSENHLRSVKKFKEPPGRDRCLSQEEMNQLLDCCPQHIRPVVVTALRTGMRKSEIFRLRWSDVDFVRKCIKVTKSKNNQSRHIPIDHVLYTLLLRLPRNAEHDFVFSGKHGKPIRSIQTAWQRALSKANITDFRFHDLRHTYASYLASNGTDPGTLMRLLGQKTIAMTLRYSHLSDDALRRAVDKLNMPDCCDTQDHTNPAHTPA
jgi:integrase